MSFRVTGMDLSGYMVQDAPRAIAFYRDVMGLEPVRYYPEDRGAEYELPDGTVFGLWGGGGKVRPFQPSNGILFAVDDFEAAARDVRERGLTIVLDHQSPHCAMIGFNDTEGNLVVLHDLKDPGT